MAKEPVFVTHRSEGKEVALVFIHGFSGAPQKTFGEFPKFLAENPRLRDWDIFSFGYPTGLGLDLIGIWRADPQIASCADGFRTAALLPPLNAYKSLALVAHSMGGLVVQRALVDDPNFVRAVGHVFLFGTPSGGLAKAAWFKFWKRQLNDMAEGGEFIVTLRDRWRSSFDPATPFKFLAIAGDQDEFVPRKSSIEPFPLNQQRVVNGDHLSIVKPSNPEHRCVQILIEGLTAGASEAGLWSSARLAVENREFHKAIKQLEPQKDGLDEQGLVQLALALEGVGRQKEAIELLERIHPDYTDAMGVLAGRLKRRWLVERQIADAERALEFYEKAYELSAAAHKQSQAFYHAINVAFLLLAYRDDLAKAQQMAHQALEHCSQAKLDKWRLATEGEAHLLLGEAQEAIQSYEAALDCKPVPSPREIDSMFQQALRVTSLLGYEQTALKLYRLFRGEEN